MNGKAIIFDLDETLRKLNFDMEYTKVESVTLRPKINGLLKELKKSKEAGIDVLIWTTATSESAKKYFIECLPEEYRDVFDKIISDDDKIELKPDSKEIQIYGYNTGNKPITALDEYNQILFFDDNSVEETYLKDLYSDENDLPNKQVVFAKYAFCPPKKYELYAYKKLASENEEIAIIVNSYLDTLLEEPGCDLMIERIHEFESMSFEKGLTCCLREPKIDEYNSKIRSIADELEDIIYENPDFKKLFFKYAEEYCSKIKKQDDYEIS